jgi:hypothetical protein
MVILSSQPLELLELEVCTTCNYALDNFQRRHWNNNNVRGLERIKKIKWKPPTIQYNQYILSTQYVPNFWLVGCIVTKPLSVQQLETKHGSQSMIVPLCIL